MNIFNTDVTFTSISFILCRKSMGAQWAWGHGFLLNDSLLNGINEKGLSKKHNVRIVNKPGATSERLLLEDLDNLIKYQP